MRSARCSRRGWLTIGLDITLALALSLGLPGQTAADEVYVVKAGDTLSAIAHQWDISTADLVAANRIADPDVILPGQQLTIPGRPRRADPPAPAPVQRTGRGSILATHRVVTYYGHPATGQMGILGQLTPDELVAALKRRAAQYEAVGGRPVIPAIHFIATVAQASPGADGLYRARTPIDVVERYVQLAEANGMLLILDVQPGRSTVRAELAPWVDLLRRPSVHLALDPEFNMAPGEVPGVQLGQMDASEINTAIDLLAGIVQANGLPNKILIVHQFDASMITNKRAIHDSPFVDFVTDMDGFGGQGIKITHYDWYVRDELIEYAGIKLFFDQDTNLMTPAEVLSLTPPPNVVIYQ